MPKAESPVYSKYMSVPPADGAATAIEFVSRPGRATSPTKRRIDVSSSAELTIEFFRLRPGHGGRIERTLLGHYVMVGGVPLLWPVPDEASFDDVLVIIVNDDEVAADVHVSDFWRSN
jgi:hypothetical protein